MTRRLRHTRFAAIALLIGGNVLLASGGIRDARAGGGGGGPCDEEENICRCSTSQIDFCDSNPLNDQQPQCRNQAWQDTTTEPDSGRATQIYDDEEEEWLDEYCQGMAH